MTNAAITSDVTLTKNRFVAGVWHGQLLGHTAEEPPQIVVSHCAKPLDGVIVDKGAEGAWSVHFAIPAELLSDGVHTFVFSNAADDAMLESFTILAGDAMADDIRAEVSLLRAELDMMKRAFRRHCLETADP